MNKVFKQYAYPKGMVNYWKDRRVLVTGCTGLLGSWLAKSLISKEANVVGLVRDEVPQSDLILSGTASKITTA